MLADSLGRQPVDRVQDGERRQGPAGCLGGPRQHRGGGRGGTFQEAVTLRRVGIGEQLLKQLTDRAEREPALELPASPAAGGRAGNQATRSSPAATLGQASSPATSSSDDAGHAPSSGVGAWNLERAIRAWAYSNPRLQAHVAALDEWAFGQVRACFKQLGFSGIAADIRSKTLYYAGIGFVHTGSLGPPERAEHRAGLLALLTER
jgi:hypothetical protein